MFLVVSLTLNGAPAPPIAGDVNAETIRSGPICSAAYVVLLPSDVSALAASPSACATTKYAPAAVLAGIVTEIEPLSLDAGANAGSERAPSSVSDASRNG